VERGINEVNAKINTVQEKITAAGKGEREQKSAFFALQREYQNLLEIVTRLRSDLGERRIALAKTDSVLKTWSPRSSRNATRRSRSPA